MIRESNLKREFPSFRKEMKTRNKIIILILFFLVLIFILLLLNPEPHFKITKNDVEVNKIEFGNGSAILKNDLTVDWLNNNCEFNQTIYKCGDYIVTAWNQIK